MKGQPRASRLTPARTESSADVEQELSRLWSQSQLGAAASLIVQVYGPGIGGYIATLVRHETAWRDAFSEFAEELWKALPRYRGAGTFRAWAYAIAHHCAMRQLRSEKRRRARPLRDSEMSKLADQVRSLGLSLSRSRRARGVEKLRALLSDEEQALLTLRVDRGMSWAEVASVLEQGQTPVALRKRYERITRRLRQAAEKDGLLPSGRQVRRGQKT